MISALELKAMDGHATHASETDANIDAIRQTAAGLALGVSLFPLSLKDRDLGDLDLFGLLES